MTVKSDRWIRKMALERRMIEPFDEKQVREGVISYGLSSYGYDARVADEFKIFTNINHTIVDPKDFDPRSFVDVRAGECIIPPNSFALARTVEYFRIPRNVIVVCVGKCLGAGTEVVDADSGRLTDITSFLGREGRAASLRRQRFAGEHVSSGSVQGVMPLWEVRTRTGRSLRATPNHPLLTFGGWRELQDLPLGSRVAVPRRLPVFGRREMPGHELDLLGLLISDGCCRTPGASPTYTSGDPVLQEAFAEAVTAFGCVPRRSTAMCLRATNRGRRGGLMEPNRVYRWLESLGLNVKSPDKFVPPVVFELRRPLLARFLRALVSGDGGISVGTESVHLEFSSTSERLAREVQHLLLRFGVVAHRRERETASGRGASVLTVTSKEHVARFAAEIGFVGGSQKQKRLEEALSLIQARPQRKSNYDTLPREAWPLMDALCRARGTTLRGMGLAWPACDQSVPRPFALDVARRLGDEMLGDIAGGDVLWDTIVGKRFVGFEPVYDITVPETSNFVANDVVVHNSTYARCGIIVNVTPLEPEWEGIVTIEVSNTTPLPARIYANEGIAQFLFFESDEPCETSYADKRGKYQAQQGLTLPKL
jgi:deoxycytidine triphosphate deaminase/intein/homing endonuclease